MYMYTHTVVGGHIHIQRDRLLHTHTYTERDRETEGVGHKETGIEGRVLFVHDFLVIEIALKS